MTIVFVPSAASAAAFFTGDSTFVFAFFFTGVLVVFALAWRVVDLLVTLDDVVFDFTACSSLLLRFLGAIETPNSYCSAFLSTSKKNK